MLSLTVRTVTTEERIDNGALTKTVVTAHQFSGGACVILTPTCLTIADPYGETERVEVSYYADYDGILGAIVDWVAQANREAIGPGNGERVMRIQTERLRRIAGAMGLEYVVPTAAAQTEDRAQ